MELIKCLRSIKEHAFVASEYPVVITLEDHLTPDLQAKVAEVSVCSFLGVSSSRVLTTFFCLEFQMVTETIGDILFSPGSECLKEFPSPESLKKRIIISTKPPKEYLEAKDAKENENGSQKGKAGDEEAWGREVKDPKSLNATHSKVCGDFMCKCCAYILLIHLTVLTFYFSQNDLDDEESNDEGDDDDLNSQQLEAPEYKRLIAIHAGKPKGGLDECLKVDPDKVRRLSMSEQQLEKAAETHGKDIVRYA